MIAVERSGPIKKVQHVSPGLCRLGEALSELMDRYPETIERAEEFPPIVVEDGPGDVWSPDHSASRA
ncbi:MAG TPA: hypothetical protein VNH11_34060 [Pirellulales bacterium]|nr:hypothetical protein [Pirellulales bacterium]